MEINICTEPKLNKSDCFQSTFHFKNWIINPDSSLIVIDEMSKKNQKTERKNFKSTIQIEN